ncbi:hypothetical protein PR003_g5031 [Phytophthora rubi]|uniref:Uncharacterized protein n=1 Tax=Phytophthora rubi TaxID=129364 RepID=A0A6A3J056_9STRA|nr:hypothetical protein PR002_g23306 [Phytophthora rubi]KAE8984983.1 hypothetical protein PR001_g23023 [Phytophthora rubi]KAE9351127.1 hypothetical protein PR003_g5031 [Phytophthora rubi]
MYVAHQHGRESRRVTEDATAVNKVVLYMKLDEGKDICDVG